MKYAFAIFAAVALFATTCHAQHLTPGLLPGVYRGYVPAGPPVTLTYQPVARVRIRTRPWWALWPPVIQYAPAIAYPQNCPPGGCQVPSWYRYEGGWGNRPAAPAYQPPQQPPQGGTR